MIPIIVGGNDKLPVCLQQQTILFGLNPVAEDSNVIQYRYLPGCYFFGIIGQDRFILGKLLF